MPGPGDTALVAPIPAAEELLAEVGRRYPGYGRDLPAHVTLLYPFVEEDRGGAVQAIASRHPPFEARFTRCEVHDGFVGLLAEPDGPLAALAADARRQWPACVPYGGVFGADPEPHLTVALGLDVPAAAIAVFARRHLPLAARIDRLLVAVFSGRWSLRREVLLGE
jgi:hypothetical protein